MSDFERQLREAMRTAVADAQPPPSVMESVRRRYWRRRIWLAAASVVAVAMLVAVVPVAGAVGGGGGRPAHGRISGAPLFPGGGRLLLDRHGALEWLYPHGRTVRLASGFAGATLAGGKLLAWKHANPPGASRFLPHGCFDPDCTRIHDLSYYTMNLDGSDARLILPAESPVGNIAFQYQDAQLSPDGSRLAYTSQELRNGTRNIFLEARELWSLDLATGQKTDLGPASTPFTWKDNATILADSADGRSIQQIDARDGTRTTYLTVDDPSLIHAYERARPGSGHPSFVGLGGWSPGASALAVTLDGRTRLGSDTGQPAEILMARGRVSAFAPVHYPSILRTMKWGPNGVFLLEAQSNPTCAWTQTMYAGAVHSQRLSRVQTIQGYWNTAAVNPAGTVIALAQRGLIDFVPVPSPACRAAGKCLRFEEKQLISPVLGPGMLLAWDRG
ncbi:MAG TPA: hypothetical protein VF940_31335 [Streptosporangiaceae bacterium]